MSRRKIPPPARMLVSVIYRDENRFALARDALGELLGEIESASGAFPFDKTDYYEEEMGSPLCRKFLAWKDPVPRDALVAAKRHAEDVENRLSRDGRRTVNIDPGLLTEENFLLATGKNYSHRIYLGDGVYADLTLVYRKGDYHPLPWTYPDYASPAVRAYLSGERDALRETRKREGRNAACG